MNLKFCPWLRYVLPLYSVKFGIRNFSIFLAIRWRRRQPPLFSLFTIWHNRSLSVLVRCRQGTYHAISKGGFSNVDNLWHGRSGIDDKITTMGGGGPKWEIFWWRNIMWMIPIDFLVYCLVYFKILMLIERERNRKTCWWILLKKKQSIASLAPSVNSKNLATSFHSHTQNPHRIFSLFCNRPSLGVRWQWHGQIVKTENKGGGYLLLQCITQKP